MAARTPRSLPHPSQRATILSNLFEAAHAAVEPWQQFRWHSAAGERLDAWKEHSSQALAIDVFGTIKTSARRDQVLDRIAAELGLPTGGAWTLTLEWHDPLNHLHEKQPTWVDAVAQSPHCLIFFECKFTETDGGACSQTRRLRPGRHNGPVPDSVTRGQAQCNGSYMWRVNPVNRREARCALTAKGIRYWEAIPRVFDYDANDSYFECPFRGSWFQWMRNLTVCAEAARHAGLKPAVVIVYADGPGLPMAARVRSPEWERLAARLQPGAITFKAFSFQRVVGLAQQAVPGEAVWQELDRWVEGKIQRVCGHRLPSAAPRRRQSPERRR